MKTNPDEKIWRNLRSERKHKKKERGRKALFIFSLTNNNYRWLKKINMYIYNGWMDEWMKVVYHNEWVRDIWMRKREFVSPYI